MYVVNAIPETARKSGGRMRVRSGGIFVYCMCGRK